MAELGFNSRRFVPCILFHAVTCIMVSIKIEIKDKQEYLERRKNEQLQKDLSHVLQQFPEGVIITTKDSENPEVLFTNQEVKAIYGFSGSESDSRNMILNKRILRPHIYIKERKLSITSNSKPKLTSADLVSTKTALDHAEQDRLFHIIRDPNNQKFNEVVGDSSSDGNENEVIMLKKVGIEFENQSCQMIIIKNWTDYVRYQLSKQQEKVQELITITFSHEMQTPINAILNMVETLLMMNLTKEQKQQCKIIRHSAMLLMYLVSDLLDFHSFKSGKFQKQIDSFNLVEEVTEVFDLFCFQAKRKNLELILEVRQNTPTDLKSDAKRLKQVLINLVSNAMKYTNQGSITIVVKFDRISNQLNIAVKDTGQGIREEQKQKLFKLFGKLEDFHHQNQTGIGLGLYITKQIVTTFGGSIVCTSKVDCGTKFKVIWDVEDHPETDYLDQQFRVSNQEVSVSSSDSEVFDFCITDRNERPDPEIYNQSILTEEIKIKSLTVIKTSKVENTLQQSDMLQILNSNDTMIRRNPKFATSA